MARFLKRILFSALVFGLSCAASGQVIVASREYDEQLYAEHVKSLEQFINRFNGCEISPVVPDTIANKEYATKISLLDFDRFNDIFQNDSLKNLVEDFLSAAQADSVPIAIEDPRNWVEAMCDFKAKGSTKTLSLKMMLEESDDNCWRWAIVDVDGLGENGLLKDKGVSPISPVEHEINFLGLRGLFVNNSANIAMTKKNGREIDSLSYFYALVYAGFLEYLGCNEVIFHCGQIDGYDFLVKEINRADCSNSGWLITEIFKTNDTEQ